jgi:hypothetical protein
MADTFTLSRNGWRQLTLLTADGERHEGVEPIRAFPLSAPGESISIVDSDGRELIYLSSLSTLDPGTRDILEEELAQREFFPHIRRIINRPADSEPAQWQVETDRGITTFQLDSADHIHRRGDHEFTIIDSHGIRYRIPDARQLDAHSRRVMERFL